LTALIRNATSLFAREPTSRHSSFVPPFLPHPEVSYVPLVHF
jgi:hypothetical protein